MIMFGPDPEGRESFSDAVLVVGRDQAQLSVSKLVLAAASEFLAALIL